MKPKSPFHNVTCCCEACAMNQVIAQPRLFVTYIYQQVLMPEVWIQKGSHRREEADSAKRQRTAALQDASRGTASIGSVRQLLECASPLALCNDPPPHVGGYGVFPDEAAKNIVDNTHKCITMLIHYECCCDSLEVE